jgi:hypothetical protein
MFPAIVFVLHGHVRNLLSNPRRIHSGQKDKEKEEYGLLWAVICFMSPPSPSLHLPPLPTPCICRTACSHVIRIRWLRESPPPTHSLTGLWPDLGNLAQSRGRSPFRSL